jgi:predicted transcriptional regulator
MPAAVRMTIDERRKYLTIMRLRYRRASKQQRGDLLDEMESVTTQDRKTLIRLINGDLVRHPRQAQRQRTYAADIDDAVRVISDALDYPCAARLTPSLNWMAQHLVKHVTVHRYPANVVYCPP